MHIARFSCTMNLRCGGSCVLLILFLWELVDAQRFRCPIPKIKNGRIRSRQRGMFIKFLCMPGYQLAGERNAFCINGTWSMPPPKCVTTTCHKKETPPINGLVYQSHGGGVLNFYCNQGFELHGPAAVFCEGLNWDNHMPSCIPSNSKPSLFCDFESADLCHWTHDLNHDMDWKQDNYKTPTGYSMETGPSFDHTKGQGNNGHYMYIESSSRRINDTARLISPIFEKTLSNTCLEFWYHMYGRTTGTLRAYVKKTTDPWPLVAENAVFSKTGNQGNVWYRAFLNLGILDQDFQIVMEGIRGNGYVSDTAIDDVRIIPNCTYDDPILTTTEVPLSVSEILKTVDSCENRCGNRSRRNESSMMISCDCDDFCYERSQCCPDFIDFCLTGSSALDDTTTEMEITTENLITGKVASTTVVKPKQTTATSKTTSTTTTTKKAPLMKMTTREVRQTNATSPPRRTTTTTSTRRPLIIVTELPTTFIPRKTFRTTITTPRIKFIKPKNPLNDGVELPKPEVDEEELDNTSIQKEENEIDGWLNRKEGNVMYPENLGQVKPEFRQHQSEPSNVKTILIIVAVCSATVLAIVPLLLLVRYGLIRLSIRRILSGNGESLSDVRFLTAEEVLDFSLNNDDL